MQKTREGECRGQGGGGGKKEQAGGGCGRESGRDRRTEEAGETGWEHGERRRK